MKSKKPIGKDKPDAKKSGRSKMEGFEMAMHGKNRGAGYKSYGKSKGGM